MINIKRICFDLLLIVPLFSFSVFASEPVPITISDELAAVVVKDFKDPDSAKFRNVRKSDYGNGNYLVCGDVNGKNSYGGYAGYKGFFVMVSDGEVLTVSILPPELSSSANKNELLVDKYKRESHARMCPEL